MGLLGLISNLGISSSAFGWMGVICGIITVTLVLVIILVQTSILNKVFIGIGAFVSVLLLIGSVKGYLYKKQIESMNFAGELFNDPYHTPPELPPIPEMNPV